MRFCAKRQFTADFNAVVIEEAMRFGVRVARQFAPQVILAVEMGPTKGPIRELAWTS